jgi:CheY-like chemotaxis protein/two-component sensor histidine kinase
MYRMRNTFLNHVSHELKTPLNGVQGILAGLADDGLTTEQKAAVREATQRADDLGEMLENLVEYSAFEAGSVGTWREVIPLRSIMSKVVSRGHALSRPDVTFVEPTDVPRVLVFTDQTKLVKALRILLQNAFRYTDRGTVSLTATREGEDVRLAVADTGRGMSESLMQALRSGAVAQGHKTDGLGLGLSLLQRINTLIGARSVIESIEGRGSTFALILPTAGEEPVEADHQPIETQSGAQASGTWNGKKVVLVADDNDLNRKVLCKMLRKLGYECIEADDGVAALAACERHGSDVGLVLMDIQMPNMDGLQATRELKAKNSSIPVVAVTANAVSSELQSYMESGMAEVLSKPVSKDQLSRILQTYAEKS